MTDWLIITLALAVFAPWADPDARTSIWAFMPSREFARVAILVACGGFALPITALFRGLKFMVSR